MDPDVLRATLASGLPVAPDSAEPLERILADYRDLVEPNATAWQHPGFLAYFPTTASGPGILGEMLVAALGQNPMIWRASPVGAALEEVVVGWLRDAFGLPATFDGLLNDTASTSSLLALAGARELAGLDVAALGLAGRPGDRRPSGVRLGGGAQLG
jgi:aromatic-L-amino-acid decarboxylase